MKTVPMTTAAEFNSRELLKSLVGQAPIVDGTTGAYTISDVHMAVKVLEKLDAGKDDDPLDLEDAEHLWLSARLSKQQWSRATPELSRFLAAVTLAEAA